MINLLSALLLFLGSVFMLVTAVGILRLPDLFTRMHAITKAGTLGTGLTLLAVAVFFHELGVSTRAVAAIAFVLITAPVAAHMIGRAGYVAGLALWEGTIVDELAGKYKAQHSVEQDRHVARSPAMSPSSAEEAEVVEDQQEEKDS